MGLGVYFGDKLNIEWERRREVKDKFKDFGWIIGKMEWLLVEMGKNGRFVDFCRILEI